jgi:primosomal protein N' (replication factor Y)
LCSVCFISEKENNALLCSKEFLSELRCITAEKYVNQKIIVLGPMPPRISKINNEYRYRIIIKCKNSKNFRNMISELLISFDKNPKFRDVTITADINPESLT